jgi:hypothetical protein
MITYVAMGNIAPHVDVINHDDAGLSNLSKADTRYS